MQTTRFPKSFPTAAETDFLHLLLCPDGELPGRFSAWSSSYEFDRIPYAELNLLPMLHKRLVRAGISGGIAGRIGGVYKLAWVRNQRLMRKAAEVCAALEAAGIPVAVLKGAALLLGTYRDVSARSIGDIDLLVEPKHASRAREIVAAHGCQVSMQRFADMSRMSPESMQRLYCGSGFSCEGMEIDLHWRLFPFDPSYAKDLPAAGIISGSAVIPFAGTGFRVPAPEDLLIHVIAHGAQGNGYRPFRWVADAVAIIRAHPMDWDGVLRKTKEGGFSAEMRTAFLYLARHAFVELPLAVQKAFESLDVSGEELRRYRQNADGPGRLVKTLRAPLSILITYGRHEAQGSLASRIAGFPRYLSSAWGLPSRWQLPGFIVGIMAGKLGMACRSFLRRILGNN